MAGARPVRPLDGFSLRPGVALVDGELEQRREPAQRVDAEVIFPSGWQLSLRIRKDCNARAQRLPKAQRSEIADKAAQTRWGKK